MERTADPQQIASEVADFLDYVNAIKDANTLISNRGKTDQYGKYQLSSKYVIDEAQSPAKEVTGGLAYYVFEAGESPYRHPIIGASQSNPKPNQYIVVRTKSKDPENERAPYLLPFWVILRHGSELGATVDDIYAHHTEHTVNISQDTA